LVKAVKLVLAGLFVALLATLVVTAQGTTPPFLDPSGQPLAGSIAEFRTVSFGGLEQRLLIRGRSTRNPVLLVLHGGPGFPEYALFRRHNAALEDHYVVVHWEQRGAGRSFSESLSASDLTIDQFRSDLHELVLDLKEEFGQEKIFLLGHSWGSILGALYAHDHPENVIAYVGLGQVSWAIEGEDRSYDFVEREAKTRGDQSALETLKRIGRPPYSISEIIEQRELVTRFGGAIRSGDTPVSLVWDMLSEPEFTWLDAYFNVRGSLLSLDSLLEPLLQVNLMADANRFEVPVFFALGRHDHQVPSDLAAEYFARLVAPAKRLIWFENSAHTPSLEEPELFNRMMIEDVRALR
jgi:pimeloyl-ACP methyl ester carboxylesterase